jgi:hypothetical protein
VVNLQDSRFILGVIEEGDKVTAIIDHKHGLKAVAMIADTLASGESAKRKKEHAGGTNVAKKAKLENGSPAAGEELANTRQELHGRHLI